MRQSHPEPHGLLSQREVYNVIPVLRAVTTAHIVYACYMRYAGNLIPRPDDPSELTNRVRKHLKRLEYKGFIERVEKVYEDEEGKQNRGWKRVAGVDGAL